MLYLIFRITLERLIGEGSFGSVYMATCPENQLTITVKQMPMMRFGALSPEVQERTMSVLH